ncbi:MAG: hypothetical protein R3A51_16875 [Nannocystaceae bacterium]|nr:hypothetical protein [Myxococcales bacterium]
MTETSPDELTGGGTGSSTDYDTTLDTTGEPDSDTATALTTTPGTTDAATETQTETDDPATTIEPTSETTDTTEDTTTSEDSSTTSGPTGGDGDLPCPPDSQTTTFEYIWIANSSQGTVSKIDTGVGHEVARYKTAIQKSEPSRTSVNQYGDVAVSNRIPGSVTKIAAVLERCEDRNNNGEIETSTSPFDILAWEKDECVLWNTPIPSIAYNTGPRPTAWEATYQDPVTCETPTPRLWIGYRDGDGDAHFLRLDGDSGDILDDAVFPNWPGDFGPYGGAVNGEGDLYAIGIADAPVVHVDAETLEITELTSPTTAVKYGIAVDENGDLWVTGTEPGNNLFHYSVPQKKWTALGGGGGNWVLGVAVDQEGRVWGAGSSPCRLVQASVDQLDYVDPAIMLPGCSQPWGVSVDDEGYVWVVDKANKAFKVDPDTHQTVAVVTGLVDPYTYSDMTGQGLKLVSSSG